MKTYPDITTRQHTQNFIKYLKKYIPKVTESQLLFFDSRKCIRVNETWTLRKTDLMAFDKFETFFEHLCSEGRAWIKIGGDSWFEQNFLVSIEYSSETGKPVTSIVIGGPVLDINLQPLEQTSILIS